MNSNPAGFDQHRANLLVPSECHLSMGTLVSTAMACRNQAQVRGEFTLIMESVDVKDFSQYAHGDIGTDARNAQQQVKVLLVSLCLAKFSHLSCSFQQGLSDAFNLSDQQIKGSPGGRQ